MLWLETIRKSYQEGEGWHCTETTVEVKELEMVRETECRLWLFLAHVGRWESGRIQETGILALPVADCI